MYVCVYMCVYTSVYFKRLFMLNNTPNLDAFWVGKKLGIFFFTTPAVV